MLIGVLLLLAVLAVVVGARRAFRGYPPTPGSIQVLAPREVAFLEAAAEALYPPGGAGVAAYTDRYLAVLPATTRRLMRCLFFLFEHATALWPADGPGGFRRYSSLSEEQRSAVLEHWRTSRFFPRRLVFVSLRAILTMGYFSSPAVLRCLSLAPYAIESPVTAADALYPPIGSPTSAIRHRPDEVTLPTPQSRPPAGVPLRSDDPLHPAFREQRP
jgi:hypothetical protein